MVKILAVNNRLPSPPIYTVFLADAVRNEDPFGCLGVGASSGRRNGMGSPVRY